MAELPQRRRKLRVLIISMGGHRQTVLKNLFESVSDRFETPVFVPGVPSRSLRNQKSFLWYCNEAGLLPKAEWEVLRSRFEDPSYNPHEKVFDALNEVPVTTEGRKGSARHREWHYSAEIWRKGKTVNRGRAVLGCTLAHLIALQRFTDEDFDVLLEDNVRFPDAEEFFERVWTIKEAKEEWEKGTGQKCHMHYFGCLGSIPNLRWINESWTPQNGLSKASIPFPQRYDIEEDLRQTESHTDMHKLTDCDEGQVRKPGGNAVWGSYGYWISKEAFEHFVSSIRNDVGALMWKSKRMRFYQVKPIDKILPRRILSHFGPHSVQLPLHPAVFRAPMLTSKIHTEYDPDFCRSTTFQLQLTGLKWSDLLLSDTEQQVVEHWMKSAEWLTPKQLLETSEQ